MTIELTAPKSWNELTTDQLMIVAEVFNLSLTREEILVVLFCRLSDLTAVVCKGEILYFLTGKGQRLHLEDYELKDFCKRFEWLFDTEPVDIANPTSIDSHLRKTSFGNYFLADSFMYDFSKTQNKKKIAKAMRVLGYKCRYLSDTKASAIALWWSGVGNMMKILYPNVFAGEQSKDDYSPFKALQNIHLMLNNNQPQQNEAIDNCNVHDVLSALNNKIEEYKKLKIEK